MEPAIKTGGIVIIRPAASYGTGDIITFGPDTKTQVPTTHRIVKTEGEGASKIFTTQGDANDAPDFSSVRSSDVDGKVIFSLPYLGFILSFARQPLGFILIVGIPAALVIFDEMAKIWKEIKRMRRKKIPHREERENLGRQYNERIYTGANILDLRFIQRNKIRKIKVESSSRLRFKTLSVLLFVFVPLVGLSSVSSTVSYYSESEISAGNILQAGTDYPNNFMGRILGAGIFNEEITEPDADINPEEPPIIEEDKSSETEEQLSATEEPPTVEEEQPVVEEELNEQNGENTEIETIEQVTEEIIEPETI